MARALLIFALVILLLSIPASCSALQDEDLVQVRAFLAEDTTDEHEYIKGVYMCGHFAEDLVINASRENITLDYAYLINPRGPIDHIVAANRINGTLYFIEPQSDLIFTEDDMRLVYRGYILSYWLTFNPSGLCYSKGVYEGRVG